MTRGQRLLRLFVLAALAASLAACHFHGCGYGPRYYVPVRGCR
jgi:ABC-type uncharacterized transport system auxiliary subunit